MAIKQITRLTAIVGSLILSQALIAANSPSSNSGFYGGFGMGGQIYTGGDISYDSSDLFISGTVGYEDIGWAVEARGAKARGFIDSSDTLTSVALAYRSIEKNGRYLKIKLGKANFETDLDTANILGLGVGFRVNRTDRLELEYEYIPFKSAENISAFNFDFPVHMISANYLFGGPGYNSRGSEGSSGIYAGVFLGILDQDIPQFDLALGYGFLLGYEFKKSAPGLAAEFQFALSLAASSIEDDDPNDGIVEEDEFKTSTYAIYAAYRTSGKFYVKGKLGLMNLYMEDEWIENGITYDTFQTNETGPSAGVGIGFKLKNDSRLELDLTVSSFDIDGLSFTPILFTTAYIF